MNKPSMDKIRSGDSVFIIESAGPVKTASRGKMATDYVLRGPAAFFGELNNNGRIYEAADYLPHMPYLQEKIKTRGLMGELDHPKEFETSLNRVSHVVESLDYDKASNSVNIQVRLVDTPYGNIAKALIESGVVLSISSRAAGQVSENNKVKLKRIFTYDLVADPGFERAQVRQICESENFDASEQLFADSGVTGGLELVNEQFGITGDGLQVYRVPESNTAFAKAMDKDQQKRDNRSQMENYVTVDEMEAYSKVILKEIASIKEQMAAGDAVPTQDHEPRLDRLEKYVRYMAESLDKSISYQAYLAENLDSVISYSKYLAENLDRGISYAEYIAEQVDNSIAYGEYIAEQVDTVIAYGDYLAEQVDNSIAYGEYIAENLDNSIAYGEYVAEQVDTVISYGDYLAENLRSSISYSEYIAENLDASIAYSEYIVEKTETLIEYGDYLAEQVENVGMEMVNESASKAATVAKDKKKNIEIINESSKDISSKIDRLIESVEKKKTAAKSDHHFFRFLSENKREEFERLDETAKEKVVDALKDKAYFSESQIIAKWNKAVAEKPASDKPAYLRMMPEKVQEAYAALTESQRSDIDAAARLHKLETQYQINHFWSTRPQINKDSVGLIKLTESEHKPTPKPAIDPRIKDLADQIGKKFRK